MIINHLSVIQDLYKRHGEGFLVSQEFEEYFNKSDKENFLLSLAYEAKDYGDSITESSFTSKIFQLFNTDYGFINPEKKLKVLLAESIFYRYFVFNKKIEYKIFFKSQVDKNVNTVEIEKLFIFSFECLRKSLICLSKARDIISELKGYEVLMLQALLNKELGNTYSSLETLGIENSYPNIDSSYVFIDQIENPDFFKNAALNLFLWCSH